MSRSVPRVRRRTAMGAALLAPLAWAAAGCDRVVSEPSRRTGPDPAGAPSEAPADRGADLDADEGLVVRALAEIDLVAALVAAVRERRPGLDAVLRPLLDLHAAHRDVLAGAVEDGGSATPDPGRIPRRAGSALELVSRRERALADHLARGAVAAESGGLARALASMSAGVRQHVARPLVALP